jgi:hypothetical protein
MSDNLKINNGRLQMVPPLTAGPDLGRRSAVSYLLVAGAGLAAVGFLAPRRAHAAYGRCTKSGCNCCGYEGSTNNCSNCGHQYSDHGGGTCQQP